MKKWNVLNVVVALALGGFVATSCVKNEESDGVKSIREGRAAELLANAKKTEAEAKLEEAKLAFVELQLEYAKALYADSLGLQKEKIAAALLKAQKELAENEEALVKAKTDLDNAKAEANANNPKLAEWAELYKQLYDLTTGYYTQWTTKSNELRTAQKAVIEATYLTAGELKLVLERDSAEAKLNLTRTTNLLNNYQTLVGKTQAQLYAEVDAVIQDTLKAGIARNAAKVKKTEAENNTKKVTRESYPAAQLIGGILSPPTDTDYPDKKIIIADPTYNLNVDFSATNAPWEADGTNKELAGYKATVKYLKERIAFLSSTSTTLIPTGYGGSISPNPGVPFTSGKYQVSIQFLKDQKARDTEYLANRTAYINEGLKKARDDAKTAFESLTPAYATALAAYQTVVPGFNSATSALKTAGDAYFAPGNTPTAAQAESLYDAVRAYAISRYALDGTLLGGITLNPPTITTVAEWFDAQLLAASGNKEAAWNAIKATIGINSQAAIDANAIEIVGFYRFKNRSSGTEFAVNSSSIPKVDFSVASATVDYAKTIIGRLAWVAKDAYGASSWADLNFLPYTVKPENQGANHTTALYTSQIVLNNYNNSKFAAWQKLEGELATAQVLVDVILPGRIAQVEALIPVYEATLANFTALLGNASGGYQKDLNDAQAEYAAKLLLVNAAKAAENIAQAEYSNAQALVSNLGTLLTALKNGDVASVKAYVDALEKAIVDNSVSPPTSGYAVDYESAVKALANYRAGLYSAADLLAENQKKADILKQAVDALLAIIASIEAKMSALL
ncbi:MAG: hypothetical protein LBS09_09130 [Bacteroidales bacterium]|jgi:hypothetical protein|nr:hypothetical protein [Bacteroidales bacterium]